MEPVDFIFTISPKSSLFCSNRLETASVAILAGFGLKRVDRGSGQAIRWRQVIVSWLWAIDLNLTTWTDQSYPKSFGDVHFLWNRKWWSHRFYIAIISRFRWRYDCKKTISRELFINLTFCQMHKMFISDSNIESDVITLENQWRHVTTTVVELVFVRGYDVIFPVIRTLGF